MKSIEIEGAAGLSRILINESLANLEKYLNGKKTVIITDENVYRLYRDRFPPFQVVIIPGGEKSKVLKTVEHIYKRLLEFEVDRSWFIVGIGGGIVCDITGFAASTYMRGLPFGFVASSLLAQVDASIGGKNGVNFLGYKNLVGLFSQPRFVICGLEMLKTLPEEELLCGFAEVVKHGAIGDAKLFALLEDRWQAGLALDMGVLEKVVYDSLVVKAAVVRRDEKETGERRVLNFGHTLGHALEKSGELPHGKAVGIGMAFAADFSVKRGLLPGQESKRVKDLLSNLRLPIALKKDKDKILDAVRKDKKRQGQGIHFVFLHGIGRAAVEEIALAELEDAIHDLC